MKEAINKKVMKEIYEIAKEIKKETSKLCDLCDSCDNCTLYHDDICLAVKSEILVEYIEENLEGEKYNED